MKNRIAPPLFALLAALALPAQADRLAVPANALYQEECASCHMAYPPQMLDTNSWRALMNGLPKHFGSDASIDEKRRIAISDFLDRNAGSRKTGVTADANGQPLLAISQTAYFQRKHRKVEPAVWQRASIKSPANCTACHAQATAGDYNERSIRIPK
ncbi:MAG: diheme cytochrome c [Rhodocyclales bacterium]|nr:diheme cytochrome c [Rhodocyclales bacterium]